MQRERSYCCFVKLKDDVVNVNVVLLTASPCHVLVPRTQDASAEARGAAKRAFAAYASRCPDQALSFLKSVEPSVRDKLAKNMAGVGESEKKGGRRNACILLGAEDSVLKHCSNF